MSDSGMRPLRDLVIPVFRRVAVSDLHEVRYAGVRWYAAGVYARKVVPADEVKASKLRTLRSGDIVYNRMWASKASFGVAGADVDGCHVTNDFPTFRAVPHRMLCGFVSLVFETEEFQSEADARATGTTERRRLKEADFLAIRVVAPPLDVQRRIVDLIGALDAQIKALGKEVNDVLTLRATVMSDHIAGGKNRSSLDTYVEVAQGKALPKERQGVTSGSVPWFKIADMTGAGNQFGYNRADTSMTPEEIAALRGKTLPIGSVVFPRVGAAVLTEKKRLLEVEGAVDENHLVLLPRQGTDSEYLLALLEWVKLSELVQPGAVPSLNMSLIKCLKVPMADPETQRALGSVLRHLRVLGRALCDEIGAARALRAITLANALSGGFEIPDSYDELVGAL